MFIKSLANKMDLNIFKCRNVKTPTKSWEAAGWDFYVPENLKIIDFIKSVEPYLNDNINYCSDNCKYKIPLKFYLNVEKLNDFSNMIIELLLTWNKKSNLWQFNIVDQIGKVTIISDESVRDIINDYDISKIELLPHGKVNIPSGIHVNLPDNVFLKVENKSGIASKRALTFLADVIDVDYEGEIHLNLVNTSDLSVFINAGEKIIQLLPLFQPQMKTAVVYNSLEELYKDKKSSRGAGGFGSSGLK